MVCIVLYSEKYGYFKSMYNNYTHHTHDSHEDYHIELISEEG